MAGVREGSGMTPLRTPTEVLNAVVDETGVPLDRIRGHERTRRIVDARQLAAFRLVTEAGTSLVRAGELLGGKHHTTVLLAVRRVQSRG